MKEILFGNETREKMLEGINLITKAVSCTLGPSGRNVLVRDIYKQPRITKDGITVAKAVVSSDPTVNAGIQLIRQASQKTCDDVGDGSTTVCILTQSMIYHVLRLTSEYDKNTNAISPINIKKGMMEAVNMVCKFIDNESVSIKNRPSLIKAIASISANNDKEIGDIVFKAVKESTSDGAITVETSPTNHSYVDTIMGMRFDRGMESSYFANDDFGRDCVLDKCLVFMYEGSLDNAMELVDVLDLAVSMKKPLLVIADSFSNDVINALAINKVQNGFKFCAVKAPSFGEQRKNMMDDLALMLGGKVVNTPQTPMEKFHENVLGLCDKVTVTKSETIITGCYGDDNEIAGRINDLRYLVEHTEDKKEQAGYRERLTKMAGGISIIYVGSDSETETNEIKDRVDDAVCAVRAALREGVVPGGGSTFLRANLYLKKESENVFSKIDKSIYEGFAIGYNSVCVSLLSSIDSLMNNAYVDGERIEEIISFLSNECSDKKKCGYNIKNMEFVEDMVKEGIVDPASVSKMTVRNAASIASMFLMTDCSIVDYSDMETSK